MWTISGHTVTVDSRRDTMGGFYMAYLESTSIYCFGNFLTMPLEISSDLFLGPSCLLDLAGEPPFSTKLTLTLYFAVQLALWFTAQSGILTQNALLHCVLLCFHIFSIGTLNLSTQRTFLYLQLTCRPRSVSTSRMARSPVRDLQDYFGLHLSGSRQWPRIPDRPGL
jgi:hypothetical protein